MSLRDLALYYKTDKAGGRDNPDNHEYCEAYEFFLKDLQRDRFFSMLEIGIGGYEYPDRGGESLRMWRDYFPDARIFALDLHEKTFKVPNVRIYQGHQGDAKLAEAIYSDAKGPFAFIVDDASHINPLTLETFRTYWPYLAPGGIYAIEDVHSSYWSDHGFEGGKFSPHSVMNFFRNQLDFLNHPHSGIDQAEYERYAFQSIESIHFFKEIIFIRKKA